MLDYEDELVQRAQARVGTIINDKWHVDRLLGVGGMAVVYVATHRNKKRAALKMLHAELSANADIRSRFLREGYAANSVEHPGVVRVDDDDVTADGAAYIVMELLEGETLDARCARKGGRLDTTDVLSIADQLLDVLAAAHDKGIVHRDLKPENIFLNRDGVLKVLDFGIARVKDASTKASATRTGTTMGTPAFMAPEQARGRVDDIDGRTDLWAVGATMFSLLTGRFVHEAETPNEQLVAACTQPAPQIGTVIPDIHPAVAQVVDRALAYNKQDRYPDARTMQIAVREAYGALQIPGQPRPAQISVPEASEVQAASVQIVSKGAAVTTARPLTVSTPSSARSRTGLVIAGVAGGVVVVVAAVIGVMALRSTPEDETHSNGLSATIATSASAGVPTAVAAPDAAVNAGGVTLSIDDLPVSNDSKPPSGGTALPVKTAGQAAPGTTQTPTPAATATATTTGTSKKDPFSKRK